MPVSKHLHYYWNTLTHPKVFMFIVLGCGVIFFTFFTTNNALEIAISCLASIFIGIGVNNFTAHEASLKSGEAARLKERHLLKLWKLANTKMQVLKSDINTVNNNQTAEKIKELNQVMELIDDCITGE